MCIRVLIADDQLRSRRSLAALLTAMRWHTLRDTEYLADDSANRVSFPVEIVGEAANGQQTVEQVQALRPDAIVMDLQMHPAPLAAAELDSRVSQATAGQVDAETRRLVEEALDSALALLRAHRRMLDRLAERLCEHETVNGSEVTAMLSEDAMLAKDASMAEDDNILPDGNLAPDGNPWQDAGLWHVWPEKARAAQDVGRAPKVSAMVGKTAAGNGHQPTNP